MGCRERMPVMPQFMFRNGSMLFKSGIPLFDQCCCPECFCTTKPASLRLTITDPTGLLTGCCISWINSWTLAYCPDCPPPTYYEAGCACYSLTVGLPCNCTSITACLFVTDLSPGPPPSYAGNVNVSMTFTFSDGSTMMLTFDSSSVVPDCSLTGLTYTGYEGGATGSGAACNTFFEVAAAIPGDAGWVSLVANMP